MTDSNNHTETIHYSTAAIRGTRLTDQTYGSVATPIYQTSTFAVPNCETGAMRFSGEQPGYYYSRMGNPTLAALEERLALLEDGEAAVVTSSGMGAIAAAVWTFCKPGSHLIADCTLYGGTYALLTEGAKEFGVDVDFIDLSDPNNLNNALRENTSMVYMETPANPTLKITDLQEITNRVHQYSPKILVAADNTIATPYLQCPLSLGCDLVLHSLTKYLNGHGDVIAGAVIGSQALIDQVRHRGLKTMTGAVLGPFEAYLVLRGLQTFPLRMEQHCNTAEQVVRLLASHPAVQKVYYPGLPDHPGHKLAKKQMRRFGGMVSFEIKGGRAAGAKLLDALKFCLLAVSLGDAETLIEHPASMSHSPYSDKELEEAGIPTGLVRLSIGLEDAADILTDLKQGLDTLLDVNSRGGN